MEKAEIFVVCNSRYLLDCGDCSHLEGPFTTKELSDFLVNMRIKAPRFNLETDFIFVKGEIVKVEPVKTVIEYNVSFSN